MKTNKILVLLATLFVVAGFTGCKSDDESTAKPAKEMLRVIGGDIEIRSGEENAVVTIKADCHWKVQNLETTQFDGELTVQPREGEGNGTLVISTSQNLSNSGRKAMFDLVSDGGLKQRITIVQTGGGDALNVSKKTFTFDAAPTASQVLTINSNTAWRIQMPTGINWVHLDKTTGSAGVETVQITIDNAVTDAVRTVSLPIVYGSGSTEVTVQQVGMSVITLSVNADHFGNFSPEGGMQEFNVISNAAWRVYVPSSAASWLSVDSTTVEGVGNGHVRVFCDANSDRQERLSTLIVVAGTVNPKQANVLVQQMGGYDDPHHDQGQQGIVSISDLKFNQQEVRATEAMAIFEFEAPSEVQSYGYCYSKSSQMPTVNDETKVVGSGGTHGFVEWLTGLEPMTTYHVRGFVYYQNNVYYTPNVIYFTTPQQ